jgi:hypothetical protein
MKYPEFLARVFDQTSRDWLHGNNKKPQSTFQRKKGNDSRVFVGRMGLQLKTKVYQPRRAEQSTMTCTRIRRTNFRHRVHILPFLGITCSRSQPARPRRLASVSRRMVGVQSIIPRRASIEKVGATRKLRIPAGLND